MGPDELMSRMNNCQKKASSATKKVSTIFPGERQLTAEELDFIQTLKESLPPIISRKELPKYLGGVVSQSLLRHADAKGQGPQVGWKIGEHSVAYKTESLLEWIVRRFGVKRMVNLTNL